MYDGCRAYVLKGAGETVTNSTTLQNDDALLFAAGANETWYVQYTLDVSASAGKGIRLDVSMPSTSGVNRICVMGYCKDDQLGLNEELHIETGLVAAAPAAVLDAVNAWTNVIIVVEAVLTTGAGAGNIVLQWAQQTAGAATTTTVNAGSFLVAHRLDTLA
jgi:hypothetical protein